MTCHYPDIGSTSDWLKRNSLSFHSIRTTTKIWVVIRHQYGIPALVTQTSFCEGSSGDLAKSWLFSQANLCAFTDFINPPTPLEIRRLCLCLFQPLFFSFYLFSFLYLKIIDCQLFAISPYIDLVQKILFR